MGLLKICLMLLPLMMIYGEGFFKIDPASQHFIDSNGSYRIFHGVDILYKIPPFYPDTETWSADNSLTEEDMKDLEKWGMNVMRLSIMWPGIFPESSFSVNETYLNKVEEIVNNLGRHGIYTVLNLHQDLLSNLFCGEGLPDYAVKAVLHGNEFPYPLRKSIKRDPDGHPNLDECKNSVPVFGVFYVAEQIGIVMKQLYVGTGYNNTNSVLNRDLNKLWKVIATKFKSNPYVMGLELFNEPWAADMYEEPWGLIPTGYTGKKYLMPLYRQLHDTIREIDDEHIIFFDPAPLDALNSGITEGPGGAKYNDRQAYSYHIYCPVLKPSGAPRSNWLCKIIDTFMMKRRMTELKQIGCGGMLTEFGALDESDSSIEELEVMAQLSDESLQGWVYSMFKQYKDITTQNRDNTEGFYYLNGTLQKKKIKTLTRTYAPIIAGLPLLMEYNPRTEDFQLKYKIQTKANIQGYTEIYKNKAYHYPKGFSFSYSPSTLQIHQINDNVIRFIHPPTLTIGQEIFIGIKKI